MSDRSVPIDKAPKPMSGPWEVVSKFVGPYEIHANGDRIALVGSDLDPFGEKHSPVATARLIAAAPELLAALTLLHDNLAEYQRINNLGGYDNQDMRTARHAIAKAKGLVACP